MHGASMKLSEVLYEHQRQVTCCVRQKRWSFKAQHACLAFPFRPFLSTLQAPAVTLPFCWVTLTGNRVFSRLFRVCVCGHVVSFAHSEETAVSVNWRRTPAAPSPSESRWLYKASWCGCTSPQTASSSLSLLQAGLETLVWLLFLLQGARVWQGSER